MLNLSTPGAAARRRCVAVAAVLGWFALSVQLYLILGTRWSMGASLLGGLMSFFSFLPC